MTGVPPSHPRQGSFQPSCVTLLEFCGGGGFAAAPRRRVSSSFPQCAVAKRRLRLAPGAAWCPLGAKPSLLSPAASPASSRTLPATHTRTALAVGFHTHTHTTREPSLSLSTSTSLIRTQNRSFSVSIKFGVASCNFKGNKSKKNEKFKTCQLFGCVSPPPPSGQLGWGKVVG